MSTSDRPTLPRDHASSPADDAGPADGAASAPGTALDGTPPPASGAADVEELTVTAADGTRLVGTLTRPPGAGPHPAALLLVGSGPVDRDSNAGRLPLSVTDRIAAHLAAVGIASLRYDKRGVGASGGDFLRASFEQNTTDARAALHALGAADGIDPERLLVVGHSEGALHAGELAADEDVVGVALLAGSARTGERILRWQAEVLVPTLPGIVRLAFRLLRVDLGRRQDKLFTQLRSTDESVIRSGGRKVNAAWFRGFLDHDPAAALTRTRAPVLAVTGAKDLQAPPEDVTRIGDLVVGPFEGLVVPDVNHILRHEPGPPSVRNYRRQVADPLDERVTSLLVAWCLRVTGSEQG